MKSYQAMPCIVIAVRWEDNVQEMVELFDCKHPFVLDENGGLLVHTATGNVTAMSRDYVTRYNGDRFDVWKPETFEKIFKQVCNR